MVAHLRDRPEAPAWCSRPVERTGTKNHPPRVRRVVQPQVLRSERDLGSTGRVQRIQATLRIQLMFLRSVFMPCPSCRRCSRISGTAQDRPPVLALILQ